MSLQKMGLQLRVSQSFRIQMKLKILFFSKANKNTITLSKLKLSPNFPQLSVTVDLLLASDCGDLKTVQTLIQNGANVNQTFNNPKFNLRWYMMLLHF